MHGAASVLAATILHQLGFDYKQLYYELEGQRERLTGNSKATVVKEILTLLDSPEFSQKIGWVESLRGSTAARQAGGLRKNSPRPARLANSAAVGIPCQLLGDQMILHQLTRICDLSTMIREM